MTEFNIIPIKCCNPWIIFFLLSLTYYLPNVESYVYAPYDSPLEEAYASQPSMNTIPYSEQDKYSQRSLFLAPPMNRQLCNTNIPDTDELIQYLYDNNMVYDYTVYNNTTTDYYEETQMNRISLLVERGGCSFEEKGKNALEINRSLGLLSSSGTSTLRIRIEELIIYNNDASNECERNPCIINFNVNGNERMNLWSVFITRGSYESISSKLFAFASNDYYWIGINRHRHPYLTRNAFQLDDETPINDFQYFVRVDGQPPRSRSTDKTNRGFTFWLYIFLTIAVLFPILKYFVFFIFVHYSCRFRRDETTNRITGIVIERTYIPDVQEPAVNDIGRRTLRRRPNNLMTEDEINNFLPTIKFGISNIRDIMKDTHYIDEFEGSQPNNDTHQEADTENVNNSEIGISTSDDIASSPTSPLSSQQKLIITAYESSTMCSICMEDFEHGEKLKLLPRCGHIFHKDCIKPWLCQRKKNCVLCQKPVVVRQHFVNEPDLSSITPVVPPQLSDEL